jgi:dienelactone hydrolase
MIRYFNYLAIIIILVYSCKYSEKPKEKFLEKHPKGTIIDRIICTKSSQQSYCLYLPSAYDPDKTWPVIYAFDSEGSGKLPVTLMKEQAERLGHILVGSNNSRNGLRPEEINHIVNILLDDTKNKLAINPRRIYTAGFSGGARVACNVAMSVKGVNGVIACSAGFQPGHNPPGFHFIGIAGSQDMNYLEMKKLDELLESLKASAQLLVFDGKHQWPPKPVINEAMILLELFAMHDSLIPVNTSVVDSILHDNLKRVGSLTSGINSDSLAKAYYLLNMTIEMLDGLINISKPKAVMDNLMKYPEIRNYLIEQAAMEEYEQQKQQEFSGAFQSQSKQWWQKEFNKISEDTVGAKKKTEKDLAIRLLGYVSLNCYGYVNMALQTQNWEALELFTEIYQQADPKNYYCYYALACLKANTGKNTEALECLKKSIQYGNKDIQKLKEDPFLKNLNGLPEFETLARK